MALLCNRWFLPKLSILGINILVFSFFWKLHIYVFYLFFTAFFFQVLLIDFF